MTPSPITAREAYERRRERAAAAPPGKKARETAAHQRFRLLTKGAAVSLLVEELGDTERKLGFTEEEVWGAVERRLREAGIFEARAKPYLYVNVTASRVGADVVAMVELALAKELHDPVSGVGASAFVWTRSGLICGRVDQSWAMSHLNMMVEGFVAEFAAANLREARQGGTT